MSQQKKTVFNIQKFCVNDGPGIRTTVFLKGCMLRCKWCHNPESKSPHPQIMLYRSKCIGCGDCVEACQAGLHSFAEDGKHNILRDSCTLCGRCVEACTGALEICGKDMTADEIIEQVMADEAFYKNSGGGMTLSGGDPLYCPGFTAELLRKAKEKGLHTCVETSGYAKPDDIRQIAQYTDLFLWDVKETDEKRHIEYTGVSNRPILDNLSLLESVGAKVVLRCPIIPTYNDRQEHLYAIGELAQRLSCVQRVEVEPYHPLGASKSEGIGVEYEIADIGFPDDQTVKEWIAAISSRTNKKVCKA